MTSDDINENQITKVAFEDFRTHFCVLDNMTFVSQSPTASQGAIFKSSQKCLSSPDNANAVFPAFSEIRLKAFNTHHHRKSIHLPPTTAGSEKQLQVSGETEVH